MSSSLRRLLREALACTSVFAGAWALVSREERLLFHRFNDRVANTRDKSFLELAGQKLTKALRAIAATSR
jgi:hypothetical protein